MSHLYNIRSCAKIGIFIIINIKARNTIMINNTALIRRSSTHVQSVFRRICRKSYDQSFRIWKQLPHRHLIHHEILKHSNKPIVFRVFGNFCVMDAFMDFFISKKVFWIIFNFSILVRRRWQYAIENSLNQFNSSWITHI